MNFIYSTIAMCKVVGVLLEGGAQRFREDQSAMEDTRDDSKDTVGRIMHPRRGLAWK
jgi:hypothetical protein